jgi:hypothetical protein
MSQTAGLLGPRYQPREKAAQGDEMTDPEKDHLHDLEVEVAAELTKAESSADGDFAAGPAEWLVDPEEAERDQVGLQSLLGAVKAMEEDSPPDITF